METREVGGVELLLAHPDELEVPWVGQEFVQEQLLAAWMVLTPEDVPLNPRILGRPGVGKTSLAYAAARRLGREVYIVQATMDTRPEDLLVTPVLSEHGRIRYVASGLVTAMLRGGVCILDEGNRMTEKSWASLAPLLDTRRYVESIVAGIKVRAHPEFRFCTTMNEDASTFEIPEYIHSRLQPQIHLDFPGREEELAILRANLPGGDDELLEYVASFLERSHRAEERYSVRDGINVARYAFKVLGAQAAGLMGEIPGHLVDPPRPPAEGGLRALVRRDPGAGIDGWLRAALASTLEGLEEGTPAAAPAGGGGAPRTGKRTGEPVPVPLAATEGGGVPPGKVPRPTPPPPMRPSERALRHAVRLVLGEEALRYLVIGPGGDGHA